MANPVPIVGPHCCVPYPVDLAIVRKVLRITDGNFVVADVNDNLTFKVIGKFLSLHDKNVIVDAAGNSIVTRLQKILTAHSRWKVFRRESSEPEDLIFTVKASSEIQLKTKSNVYLANNTSEDVCDFEVKGSWFERSRVIYVGESSTIVAQMHKKHSGQSIFLGKDKFMVTLYSKIDSAFVVALKVIIDAFNTRE